MPPVKARGMVKSTMKGESRLWNWATITKYTKSRARAIILLIWTTMSRTELLSPAISAVQPAGRSRASSLGWSSRVRRVVL